MRKSPSFFYMYIGARLFQESASFIQLSIDNMKKGGPY